MKEEEERDMKRGHDYVREQLRLNEQVLHSAAPPPGGAVVPQCKPLSGMKLSVVVSWEQDEDMTGFCGAWLHFCIRALFSPPTFISGGRPQYQSVLPRSTRFN